MESTKIKPYGVNVLAEIDVLPSVEEGVHVGKDKGTSKVTQGYYSGTALELGKDAAIMEQCPGLKKGDHIIFSDIAGYQVKTDDTYCKVIRGYDIVATTSNLRDMNVKTVKPTGDRILVEVIKEGLVNEGVYDGSKEDPREQVTQKGVVISCGPNVKETIEPGTVVAFDPYCGNPIVNDEKLFLKTVNSFDILYSVTN